MNNARCSRFILSMYVTLVTYVNFLYFYVGPTHKVLQRNPILLRKQLEPPTSTGAFLSLSLLKIMIIISPLPSRDRQLCIGHRQHAHTQHA
jgi:hypothetical protein